VIDQFVQMTQRIIAGHGFEDYLPTLLLPDEGNVVVMESDFEMSDHEPQARAWLAERVAPGQNFLAAFKVSETQFKVVGVMAGTAIERVYTAGDA
jgi:hypothetical protein